MPLDSYYSVYLINTWIKSLSLEIIFLMPQNLPYESWDDDTLHTQENKFSLNKQGYIFQIIPNL